MRRIAVEMSFFKLSAMSYEIISFVLMLLATIALYAKNINGCNSELRNGNCSID